MTLSQITLLFNHHFNLYMKRNTQLPSSNFSKQQVLLYGSMLVEKGEITQKELTLSIKHKKTIGDDSQNGIDGE
jgi:hypothetical protein